MSTVKTDNVLGSFTPLPVINSANAIETFLASAGQTVFTTTKFDQTNGIRVFAKATTGFTELAAVWTGTNTLSVSGVTLTAGQKVYAYSVGDLTLRKDFVDPIKSASMIGYKRQPMVGVVKYLQQMIDAQAVRVWEYANLITNKPVANDPSTWDWYPALQAACDYAASLTDGWQVALPTHYIKCNSKLTVKFPKTSLIGCMAVIDFSAMTSGNAIDFIRSPTGRANVLFGGNPAEMGHFSMIGPGRDKTVDAIHLGSVTGVSATTGQSPSFKNVYVQGFRDAIYADDDAYLAKFSDCEFYSNANVLNLPAGKVNYGENFSFSGGSMHGNRRVLTLEANSASVFFERVSFDFNGKEANSAFYIRNSIVNCVNCHWEMGHVNTPVTVPPLDISGDQARFTFSGGFLLAHAGSTTFSPDYFALVGAGSSVTIDGSRVFGIQPTIAFASGTGRLIVKDWELGGTSTVTGWGKDQCLRDYSFEGTDIQDMIFIQNGIGTALDWRTGENLILSNSAVIASSGAQSLRVQKKIGSSSTPTGATAFTIAIPARPGERFHYRFKCIDKDSRGGSVGVTMRWGKNLGFDKDGIPRTSQGASFSTYSFTPTASWGSYFPLNNINGNDDAACPQSADTMYLTVNTNSFVGGTGAPEGGWYSLYFDDFEIYRW